jgi:Zn-dependent membrane protease YugP
MNGLNHIIVERIAGNLTDHFDPKARVIRLSDSTYSSTSVAAIGVAAHEVGHAIQHAEGYAPVVIRSKLVPAVNFSSRFCWIAILAGILFINPSVFGGALSLVGSYFLFGGIILYAAITVFHLVTLPCELNASSRALSELEYTGWYSKDELRGSKKVLSAAAMTYVASLALSLIQLLRLILVFGRSRD